MKNPTCYCGAAFTGRTPSMFTLVGYDSPPGHDGEKAARWPDEDGEPVPVLPHDESMRLLSR